MRALGVYEFDPWAGMLRIKLDLIEFKLVTKHTSPGFRINK